jgi:DNA polymerase-3 subunit beta
VPDTIFTILGVHLRELAERAASVAPTGGFQPTLRNLQVQVQPDLIRLSGTDLDLSVVVSTPMVTATAPVTFLVPAQRLKEILREVPPGEVEVSVAEPSEGIRRVSVAGGGAIWEMQVQDGNFPALPDVEKVQFASFPAAPFVAALKAVRFAASSDGANMGLSCVMVVPDGDGSAKVTASDGARLQQARVAQFPLSLQIPAIGSPAAVDEVYRLLSRNDEQETAQVAVTGSELVFRVASSVFACRKLVTRAVDLENQIIRPAMDNRVELTVGRPELLEAIRRVRISADDKTSAIALKLSKNELTVLARDKQGNTAQQVLSVSWPGAARSMVVHHRYLSEAVSAASSPKCRILLSTERTRKGVLLLQDDDTNVTGVVSQMAGSFVGYS